MIHRIIRRGFGIIEAERLCTIEQDLGHHETGKKRGGIEMRKSTAQHNNK